MPRVFLVEDSPAEALLFREAISMFDMRADVVVARDGEQAFRLAEELGFEPDIVFMDLSVPKFNPFEFLQHVRAHHDTPVIVLTGSADPANVQRATELGAKEYIVKPTQIDEFLDSVRDAIGRWGSKALTALGCIVSGI